MKISIITAVMNGGSTLEKTIRSVLEQSYKPFEYIIKDGGSTDNTLSIAESFRDDFEKSGICYRIISEPDEGLYDAMNRGISLATGEIIGMINADDWYEPNALMAVNNAYEKEPFDLFFADIRMIRPQGGSFIKKSKNRKYATSRDWNHPTTFITAEMYKKYSYKNETLHDDYDLILRMKKDKVRIHVENEVLANFRMNGMSHERNIKKAFMRARIKYGIYRQNGYSPLYFVECYGVEFLKLIIG